MKLTRKLLFSFLLSFVAGSTFVPTDGASAQLGGKLSKGEKKKLDAGKFVARRVTQRRGKLNMIGGTSWQQVNLTPEQAWKALRDIPRYPKMLPQVSSAKVSAKRGKRRVVTISHKYGMVSVGYSLNMDYDDAGKTVVFQLDESRAHDIRAAWGFIKVSARPNGKSLLSYGVMLDIGSSIVTAALQSTIHEWVLKIPVTFKRYVHGSGRKRYTK